MRMSKQDSDCQSNVIHLRKQRKPIAPSPRHGNVAALPARSSDDPVVADGLQLMRAFLWIVDSKTRATIIQSVEEIAEQYQICK